MRDVGIVSFAQSDHVRSEDRLSDVEILQPVIQKAMEQAELTMADVGFTCSGSTDYLAGQAFSFVTTLDAVGAWPPIVESHVEMDGAWALYEAWLKIQTGAADVALVYAYSKSSPGNLPRVLSRQLDPYYYAPLWPTSVSMAGLQARQMLESGKITEQEMAEIAHRNRTNAASNPHAQLKGSASVEEILASEMLADPFRMTDVAPISDGAAAVIIAADNKAKDIVDRPAWIRGIDHRIDSHNFGDRDLTLAPSISIAAEKAGVSGAFDIAELHTPFTTQEKIAATALGLDDNVNINPSGGPLSANPMMTAGLIRLGEVGQRIMDGNANRGVAHATSGHCLQQNLVAVIEGEG